MHCVQMTQRVAKVQDEIPDQNCKAVKDRIQTTQKVVVPAADGGNPASKEVTMVQGVLHGAWCIKRNATGHVSTICERHSGDRLAQQCKNSYCSVCNLAFQRAVKQVEEDLGKRMDRRLNLWSVEIAQQRAIGM